jgi:hypothetical protein
MLLVPQVVYRRIQGQLVTNEFEWMLRKAVVV